MLSEGFSPQSPHAGETPAHPGCTWFSVPGSWFSVRDARAPRGHVVLGSRFLVLGSGRPRTQGARGSRFSVLGSRFLVLGSWFLVPGSWFSIRDARTPRDTLRRSPAGASTCSARASARSLRMRAGRPRSQGRSGLRVCGRGRPRTQGACGSRFLVPGSRFGTPAHPGGTWFSVLGSWFSVRDARAPRGHVVLGSWFLVLGSGRPRTQGRSPP